MLTKLFTKYIPIAVIVIIAVAGFTYLYAAQSWTGPWSSPPPTPNSNVDAPINVGTDLQTKDGVIIVDGIGVSLLADSSNDGEKGGNSTLCANTSGAVVICGASYQDPGFSIDGLSGNYEVGKEITQYTEFTINFSSTYLQNLLSYKLTQDFGSDLTISDDGNENILFSTSYNHTSNPITSASPIKVKFANNFTMSQNGKKSIFIDGTHTQDFMTQNSTYINWNWGRFLGKIPGGDLNTLKAAILSNSKLTYSEFTALVTLISTDPDLIQNKQYDFSTTISTSGDYIVYLYPSNLPGGAVIRQYGSGCGGSASAIYNTDYSSGITFENKHGKSRMYYIYWSPAVYTFNPFDNPFKRCLQS